MKTCITCKLSLPLSNFHERRNQCRKCKNKAQAASKAAAKLRERQQALIDLAAKDEAYLATRNIAAPRTFAYLNSTYVPEQSYARNDGLKHIQSRGV